MPSLGIKTATFQLVAYCFNQLHYHVPSRKAKAKNTVKIITVSIYNNRKTITI
jgi:hypothetical protein